MRPIKKGMKLKIQTNGNESLVMIESVNGSKIHLIDLYLGMKSIYSYSELAELIDKDIASYVFTDEDESEINKIGNVDFMSLPGRYKKEAKRRLEYIEQIKEDSISVFTESKILPSIKKVSQRLEEKPPSWRTVIRWINSYNKAGQSIRGLIPNFHRIGREKGRFNNSEEKFIDDAIESYKKMERPSIKTVYCNLKATIENHNQEVTTTQELKVPSYHTFYSRVKRMAPFELSQAREGKLITRAVFRERQGYKKTTRILERAEIDHTKLDLFVVDDDNDIPLGRPIITSIIDHYSRSVLGFNIGFEAADHVSVIKALKHAISTKSYIRKIYPKIINDWPVYGKPARLVTDRGKEFESASMDDICLDLGIVLQRNPAKMPWYKARIESHFNVINRELLDDIPGKTFSSIQDKKEYDPVKNATIRFSKFIELFHIWVVDIYQQTPRAESTLVPDKWWRDSAEKYPPIPVSFKKLDVLISLPGKRKIQKYGIKRDNIIYDSKELFDYRCKYGFVEVKIKYNPDDLGKIFVLNENDGSFFEARAVDFEYADGLSVYQHKKIKEHRKKEIDSCINPVNLAKSKKIMQEIVAGELFHKKTKARYQASRFAKKTQTETISKVKIEKEAKKKKDKKIENKSKKTSKRSDAGSASFAPKDDIQGWGDNIKLGGSDEF
ncbi:transposase family protein [uncultured Endozoicomonas sp.]|uniref:transposase family protein n=1 Tax=uncultured Endozoicomonas sp. TaxID=432652 RepID=UPI00263666F2|nr:transposase family protein [uncultured Endozoicomonas sp.]